MDKKTVLKIFQRFEKREPHPKTALAFHSSFELLIAVMLSAQATDVSVNKATKELFKQANTPQKILALGEAHLKQYIKTIGLYNTKAKNILKTCAILIKQHQGKVPETREALENLPGVGRKTANVVLNAAFHQDTIAVDTHVFRVARRIGLAEGKTPLAVEQELIHNVPKRYHKNLSHWLILHGRTTCVARKPRCPDCFIADLCEYSYKTK